MTDVISQNMTSQTLKIEVIVWAKEVELRGLPRELEAEYERRGAFWATRGLRMTTTLFQSLENEHPELSFLRREVPSLSTKHTDNAHS